MNSPYRSSSRRSRRTLALALLIGAGALLCLALGLGLGWLLFGRNGDSQQAAVPTAAAPSAAQAIAPTATLVATPAVVSQPTSIVLLQPPDLPALQALALELVNQDRAAAGLQPVEWDATAARLAQAHAEDMLVGQFFSHWNRDGYGPDHRAALLAGSSDAVFENIHAFGMRFDDGRPAPIEEWPQRVREAQAGWMQSPGHRDNILDPAHTHVGVGIAYRPEIGELRLVQEFVNRYVALAPLPAEAAPGAEWPLEGRLGAGASDPIVNLAYEPFPQPLTPAQLAATSAYRSPAVTFAAPAVQVDGERFQARLRFDHEPRPGLYHVRVFVTVAGQPVLAASPIVVVR